MSKGEIMHLVATGSATALGGYQDATYAAIRVSYANFTEHPFLLDLSGENYKVAMAPYIDHSLQGLARMNPLLNYAFSDAFAHFEGLPNTLPCVLCLPEARASFDFNDTRILIHQLLRDCEGLEVSTQDIFPYGHSAVFWALQRAHNHINQLNNEFCVLAGVDSWIDSHTLNVLELYRHVKTSAHAYGFIPGEAAACVLLCNETTLNKYQLSSLGSIPYFAQAREPMHHREGVSLGWGLTEAMRSVLDKLPKNTLIDCSLCDLNGEPHRSDEFGFSLTRLRKYFSSPDRFITPADGWGDVGAASGILNLSLANWFVADNKSSASSMLLWGSSMGPERGAAMFQTHA